MSCSPSAGAARARLSSPSFPRHNGLCVGLAWMLLGAASPASAIAPDNRSDALEILLPEFELHQYRSPDVDRARARTVSEFESRHGGRWHVYSWNPQSKTPASVYGTGIEVGSPLSTDDDVESVARRFIEQEPALFGVSNDLLRRTSVRRGLGKISIHFQETYRGLDVLDRGVHLTFHERGRLFEMGSTSLADLSLSTQPSVPRSVAEAIARDDLPFDPATDAVLEATQLLVLPIPQSETKVDARLAWQVKVTTTEPIGIWVTFVDARSGEILWRYNDVRFLDFLGDAETDIWPTTYCNPMQPDTPLSYLKVDVAGVGSTQTDVDGTWSLTAPNSTPRTVSGRFYGSYLEVHNQGGADATFSGTATPGVPYLIDFTDANSQRDERDVFTAVGAVRDFLLPIHPDLSIINARVWANVSINAACNAFWSGSINFYRQMGSCANTGEIQGTVWHEYGHAVQHVVVGQQGGEGLGEGNSDILANLLTQESTQARGFYLNQCDSGLRYSKNARRYPEDVIGQEAHSAGRVIAGFHWDAMERLQQIHGLDTGTFLAAERWHNGRWLEKPLTQPDQVLATFIADDDDGNLDNGTPNYDTFCLAAQNHGFTCPPITQGQVITHVPPLSRTIAGDVGILAGVEWFSGAGSVALYWRLDGGGWTQTSMSATENPNEYAATLVGLGVPSEVDYYIVATDGSNFEVRSPREAPLTSHTFDVANLFDDLENASGWAVNPLLQDTASLGRWELLDPIFTSAQPENDHTQGTGTLCWVTGNGVPGGVAAENDVDGGVTSLYTPVFDLTGASSAVVKYWRWFSNNAGAGADTDAWVVQARNNGGSWIDLERTYDASNAWVQQRFDLFTLFGGLLGDVQLRFLASDEDAPSIVEALVDDFALLAVFNPAAAPDPGLPRRAALELPHPNPSSRNVIIAFQLPADGPLRISIYNVGGREVRSLWDGPKPAGFHRVEWDGRDERSRLVPSGVYFVRMEAGEFRATRRLVIR